MPNYKLSTRTIDDMNLVAQKLVDRRVTQMTSSIPLTFDQVQAGILPERWRDAVHDMKKSGVAFIESKSAKIDIAHSDIPRAIIVQIAVHSIEQFVGASRWNKLTFDTSVLNNDEMAALVKWANDGVQELRVAKLVKNVIEKFLKNHTASTGQVLARWPALTMLVDQMPTVLNSVFDSPSTSEIRRMLRIRFSDRPKSLKPYKWDMYETWPVKNRKAMELAEMILTSAAMLPTDYKYESELTASILSWVPAPGDLDKP
jgi:hypothetical protein